MKRILVTTDFCNGAKKLLNEHRSNDIHELRTVLILLANGRPIPKKYKDHQLTNNEFRELHISGDTLLLYKNESDSDTLVVSLKLTNITDHKSLNRDSKRKDYRYTEVSTQDLHDSTSSINFTLSSIDEEYLYDLVESIADYASMYMFYGYAELTNYYLSDTELHCEYEYISYESKLCEDTIDLVIPLNEYVSDSISELDTYVEYFAEIVRNQFEQT